MTYPWAYFLVTKAPVYVFWDPLPNELMRTKDNIVLNPWASFQYLRYIEFEEQGHISANCFVFRLSPIYPLG